MRTLLSAALLCSATVASAQTTIETPAGADGVIYFGKPDTQTYGQTFTVPVGEDTRLDAFSFWMQSEGGLNFRGYVYAWDALSGRATGDALFASAVTAAPNAGSGYHQVTLATGGLNLTGGNMYVAFLSTSGVAGSGQNGWQQSTGNTYAGGEFVYVNNGDDQGAWTSSTWSGGHLGAGGDIRFSMTFNSAGAVSAVPEPATVLLSASGLLALGGLGALRRRRDASRG